MSFNLVKAPWIPVLYQDGKASKISLNRLFRDGENVRDLAVNAIQRIALMRLLICIVQAALDGPENEQEWVDCRKRIAASAIAYLNEWLDRFDLYGDEPFMQVPSLTSKTNCGKPLEVLDCRSPHGGSGTPLFDHQALGAPDTNDVGGVALNLVTALNFSTGGKVGQAVWDGQVCNHPTFAAPCIKATHTFIRGANIIRTLQLNLLTKHGQLTGVDKLPNISWGQPVWEAFPKGPWDKKAFQNAAETYLGRLVPFSRLVNLEAYPKKCIFGPPPKQFKIAQLPEFREPSTTVVHNHRGEPQYLAVSSSKHIWRELGAVLARQATENKRGAIVLDAIERYASFLGQETIDVWVGGLELGSQAAKLNEIVEWTFSIPLTALRDSALKRYESGIQLADRGADVLRHAVIAYYKAMHEQIDVQSIPRVSADCCYWGALDRSFPQLLVAASDASLSLTDLWYPRVIHAMQAAFEQACPHITPRQIQAFAKARQKLRLKSLSGSSRD